MAISKGDTVQWNTSQGETTGKVIEQKTSDFTFSGQKFKPTDDDPYWIDSFADRRVISAAERERIVGVIDIAARAV